MAPLPHASNGESTVKEKTAFHHPYQPYEIQKQFMSALYECIEEGKVGIFESPTAHFNETLTDPGLDDEEPDWMLEHARKEKRRNALQQRADLETRLAKIRAKEKRLKERYQNGEPQQKRPKTTTDGKASEEEDDEAQFILDDYDSDDNSDEKAGTNVSADFGISAETQALMKKLGMGVGDAPAEEEAELEDELRIFFCSRTHSQLSQFAGELRRVKLPPAIPPDPSGEETKVETGLEEEVKHLTLGSRRNLCINPKVSKLGSATAINERCLELQQP
ncbi:ATP-dependent DNA helicase chl1, partial [Cryomyces antarcticus]